MFKDSNLQQLYDALKAKSQLSLPNSLVVDTTIEYLDIYDLDNCQKRTVKADVIRVYNFLKCSSRIYMKAFTGKIDENRETYDNQFITEELYLEILISGHKSVVRNRKTLSFLAVDH